MNVKNASNNAVADDAINKGIQYLLSLIENRRWRGFPTLAGESDVWVSGFVLAHICAICARNEAIAEAQQFLIASQHSSGGWSYSSHVPPDADSAAWCLMALQTCEEFNAAALEKATIFLWSHLVNGGFSTYKKDSGILEFISAPGPETISGWTSAHPDVSMAAVLADIKNEKVTGILKWVCSMQKKGLINSYWWRGPYYTTALFLRALSALKLRLPGHQAKKIAESLIAGQSSNGGFVLCSSENDDSFTTALALESFTHLSYPDLYQQIVNCENALLRLQNKNGSWPGDFIMRLPAPFISDPNQVSSWSNTGGGGNSYIEDRDGIFATAMACYVLNSRRKKEMQDYGAEEVTIFK
ncbi:MAG TPA: prenyltransferase/squalene oxidase repeat-containing protein [Hanamia sp.]